MIGEEIARLADLRDRGVLTEDEFNAEKARLLGSVAPRAPAATANREADSDRSAGNGARSRIELDASPVPAIVPDRTGLAKIAGFGCLALLAVMFIAMIAAPGSNSSGNHVDNVMEQLNPEAPTPVDSNVTSPSEPVVSEPQSPWSYSEDEDKVRGGTSYFASTTSTNSISQSPPYDSDTTMTIMVRKSPAYGTDVILTISSGQMMCPSYEGCSATVRFDSGPAEEISLNGPADNSSDTVFVEGAKGFIAKLKRAKKVTIEKTLYEAGNPQFEFDVSGLKWDH